MNSIDKASALMTLEAASETDAPVSLLAAHMTISCTGKLRAATEEGVVVQLASTPVEPLLAGDRCAVTFPLAGHSAGFTSRVLRTIDADGGGVIVTVDVPEMIQPSEQRMSVRIPVPPGALAVAVLHGETPHVVEPIDISLDGILIEFAEGVAPDVDIGHRRMVVLKRDNFSLLVEAEVRRRDGRRFGILFMFRDGRPREIIKIVSELQHRWNEGDEPQGPYGLKPLGV